MNDIENGSNGTGGRAAGRMSRRTLGLAALLAPFAASAPARAAIEIPISREHCIMKRLIGNEELLSMIAEDLKRVPAAERKGTRYLTFANLIGAGTAKADLELYRGSVVKVLNSLNPSSPVIYEERRHEDREIIRIRLEDVAWSAADWDELIKLYPYNTQPKVEAVAAIEAATGIRLPYVRADWFAYQASRKAELQPATKLLGLGMMTALAERYDLLVDPVNAAADLGIALKEFSSAEMPRGSLRGIMRRLRQEIPVTRDQFESRFSDLSEYLTNDNPVVPKAG